jgi:phosphoglycolate phosphatase-like HAD superfamily hydrolase
MRELDMERFMVEMCRMWPGKFQDAELQDFFARLRKFRLEDVLGAMNEHKNTSKFAPRVSELLARLKGKEIYGQDHAPEPKKDMPWPEIIRRNNPHLGNCSDAEAILRFYRSEWSTYAHNANQRMVGLPNIPAAERMRERAKQQAEGCRRQCANGCLSALVAMGVDYEAAARWSACLMSPRPEFEQALDDLRERGIEMAGSPPAETESVEELVEVFA